MRLNLRNIFLFDAMGAAASFVLTGLVLPMFAEVVGLSKQTLYGLAIFPLVYLTYSLTCYFRSREPQPWMLKILILANFSYGVISGLMIFLHPDITGWGQGLLGAEILALLFVIAIELRTLSVSRDELK